ncbi:MAG: hypothetical protein COT18_12590 [Elusimicrobia bacterium CG08_land_8_20_14_0_20_59_10]|nr:MAG: hypothetical protein COT18_12590 [Elusimicrobia bacterium CG08_land_8_20_14_0_20_59_10]
MKTCPACGYDHNPDAENYCVICRRDISAVPPRAEPPAPKNEGKGMVVAGILLLLCALAAFFFHAGPDRTDAGRRAEAPAQYENAADYDSVLYSLDKMGELRFLPLRDKKLVLPLLKDGDDRVGYLAARRIGEWARAEKDPAAAALWFEALLEAAASGPVSSRRQAAFELGFTAVSGFDPRRYLAGIRPVSKALVSDKDEELRAAGFFLASMSGIEDFNGQMADALKSSPSPAARLYAACGLSRLGRPEGHQYLFSASSGPEEPLKSEAISCLSYSVSGDADRFLLSLSREAADAETAVAAKRALMFRKQLAIIKY